MKTLDEMWADQAETQREIGLDPRNMTTMERTRVAKDMVLGLYEEVQELSRVTTQYKAHVLKARPVERINAADEIADILKYTIALAQLFGISTKDVAEAFQRKTRVFKDKARGERLELERHTRVVVTDLDGCVADLSSWSQKLEEARGGAPMNDRTVAMLESLKEDFYRDGGFTHLPTVKGSVEGLCAIAALGYKIVIVTARPQWQYKRIHGDTIEWLAKNGVPYDLLLFNKDKAEAVYESIFPARPLFFVEDRAKHALELANIGVSVLLLGSAGDELAEHRLIKRVPDWSAIVEEVKCNPK